MEYPDEPLWNALRQVNDPEWPISLVDMGLVYDVRREGGAVTVDLTFTAMGCPAMTYILDDVREALLRQPGVERVEVNIVWSPPWTARRLSDEGREQMMLLGVAL